MFWRAKLGEGQAAQSGARRRRYLVLALLALGLMANPAGMITSAESPAASGGPIMFSTYLGQQATAMLARATQLAGDMHALYRVTRLDEIELQSQSAANSGQLVLCKDSAPVGTPRKART